MSYREYGSPPVKATTPLVKSRLIRIPRCCRLATMPDGMPDCQLRAPLEVVAFLSVASPRPLYSFIHMGQQFHADPLGVEPLATSTKFRSG